MDLASDVNNCGDCGIACGGGQVCVEGSCVEDPALQEQVDNLTAQIATLDLEIADLQAQLNRELYLQGDVDCNNVVNFLDAWLIADGKTRVCTR